MLPLSASPVGNFYIYSFDGKLLQTYDVYGTLLKDYIYMGSRLVAEYDHVGARLLYYTPDQINSTRVITDQGGNVVYSAVHDPYGEIQQSWVNSYDPVLKFSGKERDQESELDYFGARYYDRSQYRFANADPKINLWRTLRSPVCWNLYAYCHNSPMAFVDLDGRDEQNFIYVLRIDKGTNSTTGLLFFNGQYCGKTWELPWNNDIPFQSCAPEGTYSGYLRLRSFGWVVEFNEGIRTELEFHTSGDLNFGCIEALDDAALSRVIAVLLGQAAKLGIGQTLDGRGNTVINIPIKIAIDWIGYYWYNPFWRLEMIGRSSSSADPVPQGTVSYSVVINNLPN
jgi:RHS repeat-associated protein